MKLRIYLDTSVISTFYDGRAPDECAVTQEFWKRLADFHAETSDLTVQELKQCGDADLRAKFEDRVSDIQVFPLIPEMRILRRITSTPEFSRQPCSTMLCTLPRRC